MSRYDSDWVRRALQGREGSWRYPKLAAAAVREAFKIPRKPRVFVSYHHGNDQAYYDAFTRVFSDHYDIITDRSLERRLDSDDVDYQQRHIREQNITGSSLTIVLCGPETWKRRWIDWEIHMTLNKNHGLLGIVLPTHSLNDRREIIVPDRLAANIQSGFAQWIHWTTNPRALDVAVKIGLLKAKTVGNIRNDAPRMKRSIP
jgi:hypothetical protein